MDTSELVTKTIRIILMTKAIHKLTGKTLTIIDDYGLVCKCEQEEEIVITEKPYLATKTQICLKENLTIINKTVSK